MHSVGTRRIGCKPGEMLVFGPESMALKVQRSSDQGHHLDRAEMDADGEPALKQLGANSFALATRMWQKIVLPASVPSIEGITCRKLNLRQTKGFLLSNLDKPCGRPFCPLDKRSSCVYYSANPCF